MKKTHITFETVDNSDEKNKITLRVTKPSPNQLHKSQLEYNSVFAELLNRDKPALLREALDDHMRKQGLWSDEKQVEYDALLKKLNANELALTKGGIKLSEGKELAIEMRKTRREMNRLNSKRSSLDNHTAQGIADNHSFDYLVSECTVYDESGKRYFRDINDYREREGEEASFKASQNLMALLYGVDTDFEKKLPENQFLQKYGFADDNLRLIDKSGNFVDEKGRRINEKYQLVDANGDLVDEDGNRITEDGEYVVEKSPFLDEEGNPV